ncbi:MAG: amidase domain-containing protein [Ruminococcus sp.]|nr:amidase domain-containing protein [Ruminococcus sp.]
MKNIPYSRTDAVEYALQWALSRNPAYYDFENIGGDCTNFISQCVFAGCKAMNYTADTGWYYNSLGDRAPAWTSVDYLYRFLVSNKGAGPYGSATDLRSAKIGDILQLATGNNFHHSCIITSFRNGSPLVCAHTFDVRNKPLYMYEFDQIRAVHIEGARTY